MVVNNGGLPWTLRPFLIAGHLTNEAFYWGHNAANEKKLHTLCRFWLVKTIF